MKKVRTPSVDDLQAIIEQELRKWDYAFAKASHGDFSALIYCLRSDQKTLSERYLRNRIADLLTKEGEFKKRRGRPKLTDVEIGVARAKDPLNMAEVCLDSFLAQADPPRRKRKLEDLEAAVNYVNSLPGEKRQITVEQFRTHLRRSRNARCR